MAQTEPCQSPGRHGEPSIDQKDLSSDTDSSDFLSVTVVVAKHGEQMLMKRDGEDLQAMFDFPLVESPYERSKPFRKRICAFFGISANTYLALSSMLGESTEEDSFLIDVLEVIGETCPLGESFEWVDWKKLGSKFNNVCPDLRVTRFLRSYLSNEVVPEPNLSLTPWRRVGWYSDFLPLLLDITKKAGLELIGHPEQVHFGHYSTVFELPTNQETVFVKIGFTGNSEPRITRVITDIFPNETPKILATDDKLELMICADHGQSIHAKYVVITSDKPQLESSKLKRLYESVMTEWARLQKESIGVQKDLASRGVPVYDPPQIREGYTELVSYMKKAELDVEFEKVFQMDAHLEKTFAAWSRFKLPNTLIHGDLHGSNIAQPGGLESKFVFFDWDCAFIGHPFLDLYYSDPDDEMKLGEDKYLQCWQEYECLETLRHLLLMTQPVRFLIEAFRDVRKGVWTEQERKELVSDHLENVIECLEKVKDENIGETISA